MKSSGEVPAARPADGVRRGWERVSEMTAASDVEQELAVRLETAERQLADVQRLAQVGFFEWTIATDELVWSDELYRMFGYRPGEFRPSYARWLEAIHPDDRATAAEIVQRAHATLESYAFDHRVVHPDGRVRVLHGRGHVVCDGDGTPVRIVGVTSDVTERRREERHLNDLVQDAAHHLRTPLAAIQGAAEVIGEPDVPPPLRDGAVAALGRQVQRLRRLSDELLQLQSLRPDGGAVMLAPVPVHEAAAEAVAELASDHRTRVTLEVDPDLVVCASRSHLRRLIGCLLDNAVTHGGDHVVLRARTVGFDGVIEVIDDGPGVADDVRDQLFQLFARGRSASSPGDGLGLVVVRRITELLGGSVAYQPRSPRGAHFTVTLERSGAHLAG